MSQETQPLSPCSCPKNRHNPNCVNYIITNDSAGGAGHDPKPDWPGLRHEYETTRISRRDLAKARNVSYSTLEKRAIREGWLQNAKLIGKTASQVEAKVESKVLARVERELAPWIEEKKTEWTKRGFNVGSRGFDRVERMLDANGKLDAKTEAFISKSAETYHRIGRVALGMSDGTAPGGSISLNLMCDRAAVQVVSPAS